MPDKLDRFVRKVKKSSPNVNPWAVCSKSSVYKRKKGGGWSKHK